MLISKTCLFRQVLLIIFLYNSWIQVVNSNRNIDIDMYLLIHETNVLRYKMGLQIKYIMQLNAA